MLLDAALAIGRNMIQGNGDRYGNFIDSSNNQIIGKLSPTSAFVCVWVYVCWCAPV